MEESGREAPAKPLSEPLIMKARRGASLPTRLVIDRAVG